METLEGGPQPAAQTVRGRIRITGRAQPCLTYTTSPVLLEAFYLFRFWPRCVLFFGSFKLTLALPALIRASSESLTKHSTIERLNDTAFSIQTKGNHDRKLPLGASLVNGTT